MVSYSYTRTISGRIFNQKSAVEELDLDRGIGVCVVITVVVVTVMNMQDKF